MSATADTADPRQGNKSITDAEVSVYATHGLSTGPGSGANTRARSARAATRTGSKSADSTRTTGLTRDDATDGLTRIRQLHLGTAPLVCCSATMAYGSTDACPSFSQNRNRG